MHWKNRWIAALRSGNYPQVKGTLCRWDESDPDRQPTAEGYCCLGVLAETMQPGATAPNFTGYDAMAGWCSEGGGGLQYEDELGEEFISRHKMSVLYEEAPEAVLAFREKLKITPAVSSTGDPNTWDTVLMNLNDSGKVTFNEIADLIEEYM